jgi:hypothetical protein
MNPQPLCQENNDFFVISHANRNKYDIFLTEGCGVYMLKGSQPERKEKTMLDKQKYVAYSDGHTNLCYSPLAKTKRISATSTTLAEALLQMGFVNSPVQSLLNNTPTPYIRQRLRVELGTRQITIAYLVSPQNYLYDTYSFNQFKSLHEALETIETSISNFRNKSQL